MLNREKIINIYAEKIRDLMEVALVKCLQEVTYGIKANNSDKERFRILKELSQLTSEFLKDKEIKDKILKLADESLENGENNKEKLRMFNVLRNIISHFPCFDSYDDIILSKEILTWNNPTDKGILNYFKANDGKTLTSKIYYKNLNGEYEKIKEINIKITEIAEGTEIKLSDIISLSDAIWMFSIVDYYLDYLGLEINPQFGLSI